MNGRLDWWLYASTWYKYTKLIKRWMLLTAFVFGWRETWGGGRVRWGLSAVARNHEWMQLNGFKCVTELWFNMFGKRFGKFEEMSGNYLAGFWLWIWWGTRDLYYIEYSHVERFWLLGKNFSRTAILKMSVYNSFENSLYIQSIFSQRFVHKIIKGGRIKAWPEGRITKP